MSRQNFSCGDQEFSSEQIHEKTIQDVLLSARDHGNSVLCLCQTDGVPMVPRRCNGKIFLARWPDSGDQHHVECTSFDPTSNPMAIRECADGSIEIKASFSLSGGPSISSRPASRNIADRSRSPTAIRHQTLTLSGVLHELWRRAGFDKWFPAMAGHRKWGVVQHYIANAASAVQIGRDALEDYFVPVVPFARAKASSVDEQAKQLREKIDAHGCAVVFAPIKAIASSPHGYRIDLTHLPGVPFYSSRSFGLHERLSRLRGGGRIVALVQVDVRGRFFHVGDIGTISITKNWLPYDSPGDAITLDALVAAGERFIACHGHTKVGDAVAILLNGGEESRQVFSEPTFPCGFRVESNK